MPPKKQPVKMTAPKSLQQVVAEVGLYPAEAYDFLQQGLSHAVEQIHGRASGPDVNRHVSGQQLCEGLREYALSRWGRLAGSVLWRWNITATIDFGRIVFALIDAGHMQRTENDHIEDFRDVYDFRAAFEADYVIPIHQVA